MQQGEMLAVLEALEGWLPELLASADGWTSVDVDYEQPRVERLWRQVGDERLFLHRIHPCDRPLLHPHPWPSAVRVVSGAYEMKVGQGALDKAPTTTSTLRLAAGSAYEMVHLDEWHSVRPIGGPSLSVMVVGRPWKRWSPGKGAARASLTDEVVRGMLDAFRPFYPPPRGAA